MSRRDERRRRLAEALQVNRMSIFVPAVIGLGLAFWVVSELRELVRDSRDDSRDRRATLAAEAVPAAVRGTSPDRGRGLRPRPLYLLLAVMMLGAGRPDPQRSPDVRLPRPVAPRGDPRHRVDL